MELLPDVVEYAISPSPVISGSEVVLSDTLFLVKGIDYSMDYKRGILRLLRFPESKYIQIQYILIPEGLSQPLYTYQVLAPSDSLFNTIAPRKQNWFNEDGKLQISGSKTFAITFSDDDAFDLKQSLYVNLDGELSNNVNITAQLSDSQSKLTPEGDSKELSSLDKVFIRVYGKQYEIAMGDLEWKFEGTRYINYQTSIEGINAWYRNRHFAQAGFTAAGGKPSFLKIPIIDGKQGPYYLNPTSYQSTFLLIAGSEEIYLDGTLLERGKDYYIDYSEGSVMFRTLVTSSNTVNAYFQYSDEYYKQSTYFNSSRIQILPGLSIAHHFIHQADSKDNPLLHDFSASDKDSLRMAGDNVVWSNGVFEVTVGTGTYIRKYTTEGIEYYEYAAEDTTASYNVIFSYVGSGNGDYEEFSSGKYRYVGFHLGEWQPQKRLIPSVKRSNADLQLDFQSGGLRLGLEGIYTANDKNTFSRLDDNDNQSGIVHGFGVLQAGEIDRESSLRMDFEKRWAKSFLFAQSIDQGQEYDFTSLLVADSLSQTQVDLSLGTLRWNWWKPQVSVRYRDVTDLFTQKALRINSQSTGIGLFPALSIRSTISEQIYADPALSQSILQYHDLSSSWDYRWLKAKLLLNYNGLEYEQSSITTPGNRYFKINPQLIIGDPKITLSQLSYSRDETSLKTTDWQNISTSQTYALRHTTTTLNHTVNLDFTHREIQKPGDNPKSNYDLISLRNSHYFFKQAIMLNGNYQLNQTEFFPKIRELEYIGDGLGLYDSTGVYTTDGDYDYIYITSDQGVLSTELNGQLSIYLKPGNIFPNWRRIHSDIIVQATEQSPELQSWRSYFFYPGTVFDADTTIFGKQSYTQTLWLDIIDNHVMGNASLQIDRNLDNRYQSLSRTYQILRSMELDFKQYWGNNFNAKYEHSIETDTRYMSDITLQTLGLLIQRNISTSSIVLLNLSAFAEDGKNQSNAEAYTLRGGGVEPSYRGSWGKKGRFSSRLGIRYNQRSGSDFMNFLPEKRDGFLANWGISALYRINNFSSVSLEYTGSAYPDDDMKHSLKLEFKAEL